MMNLRHRMLLAAASVVAASVGLVPGAAHADGGTATAGVRIRVVDQDGTALRPATVMACPYEAGVPDCTSPITDETNRRGVARLRLPRNQRFEFTAFVRDPDPAWACPGFELDGSVFYFSADRISGKPREIARGATLTIVEPTPFDCAPVTVTDDQGNPLPTAGLFVCPLAADGTPCAAPSFDGPDADGVIRLAVEPGVTYRLSAFIVNSGWPCPAFVGPNGDTFHFSPERDITADELAVGPTSFVIRRPDAQECP